MISEKEDAVNKVVTYYYRLYRRSKGHKHPRLKSAQTERVRREISAFMEDCLFDFEDMKPVIKRHFKRPIKTDYNINHFATSGILGNLFYDVFYWQITRVFGLSCAMQFDNFLYSPSPDIVFLYHNRLNYLTIYS